MEKRRFMRAVVAMVVCVLGLCTLLAVAAPEQRPNDRVLEKRTFIHYKKGHAKPDHPGKPGKNSEGDYTYMANGLRWKTTEPFVFNEAGSGLGAAQVRDAIVPAMAAWEEHGGDIFGDLNRSGQAVWNDAAVDGQNTFTFGSYPDENVIAVTNVWGYFNAPPRFREIVEVDVLFNTAYPWGKAEDVSTPVMDLQNIATHEIGHGAGMGDLYNADAGEETMYGYSDYDEITKRDLYTGDIAGITRLYQ